jgi:hypothetical protein
MNARSKVWIIVRRVLLGLLVGLILLALLFKIFCVEENWRGRRTLARCENKLRARGERLDVASFIPPAVPDSENFAMAPLLAPLGESTWQELKQKPQQPGSPIERLGKVDLRASAGNPKEVLKLGDYETGRPIDFVSVQRCLEKQVPQNVIGGQHEAARAVLDWLTRWSSEVEEFSAAANRRHARFPLDYSKGIAVQLPHISPLLRFSMVYRLRASAALTAGDMQLALRDLQTLDRIQAALRSEPLLISCLVRIAIIKNMLQPIWQAAMQQSWDEDQLRQIQAMLAQIDLFADYSQVIRGERALANVTYENFRNHHQHANSIVSEDLSSIGMPRWFWIFAFMPNEAVMCQNQASNERWMQDYVLPIIDVPTHRVYPQRQKNAVSVNDERTSTPYNVLAKMTAETTNAFPIRIASVQVALEQAVVACALERFRLRNGQFPEALKALVPDYAHAIPHDLIDGAPLRYRRESEGSYKLYSVGWDEVDDGGMIAMKSVNSSRRDDQQGDWVWLSSPRN